MARIITTQFKPVNKFLKMMRDAAPDSLRQFFYRLGLFMITRPGQPQESERPRHYPSIEAAMATLRDAGFRPSHCIDIGAYHGEWAEMFLREFPESRVLMVEAQEGKRERLAAVGGRFPGKLELRMALLGASEGQDVEFFEMETGSSVLEERSPYPRQSVRKRLKTLDGLLEEVPEFKSAAVIKLDTQGYELEILKGAPGILQMAEVVLMEASLVPVNSNCPLVADVIGFMRTRGFRLFDFCSQIRRRDGVLWQTDLLFVREGSTYLPSPELTYANWGT